MHIFAWSPNPYAPKNRRRPMVTPVPRVHRFQQLDSMLINHRGRFEGPHGRYGRGRRWNNRSRLPRQNEDIEFTRVRSQEPTVTSPTSQGGDANAEISASSNARNRSTLPNNFNRFRMGSINWSLWGCFIVITTLLIPAHIYLKRYAYRGELIGIFFVITLFFLVCFSVSMFHTKTRAILLHRLHLEEEMRACQANGAALSATTTNGQQHPNSCLQRESELNRQAVRGSRSTPEFQMNGETRIGIEDGNRSQQSSDNQGITRSISEASRGSDISPGWDPFGEPPPYEVAILLPTPSPDGPVRSCETPPPAYDIIQ